MIRLNLMIFLLSIPIFSFGENFCSYLFAKSETYENKTFDMDKISELEYAVGEKDLFQFIDAKSFRKIKNPSEFARTLREELGYSFNFSSPQPKLLSMFVPFFAKIIDSIPLAERVIVAEELIATMADLKFLDNNRYQISEQYILKVAQDSPTQNMKRAGNTIGDFYRFMILALALEQGYILKKFNQQYDIPFNFKGLSNNIFVALDAIKDTASSGLIPVPVINLSEVQIFKKYWEHGVVPLAINDRIEGTYDRFKFNPFELYNFLRLNFVAHDAAHGRTMQGAIRELNQLTQSRTESIETLNRWRNEMYRRINQQALDIRPALRKLAWFLEHDILVQDSSDVIVRNSFTKFAKGSRLTSEEREFLNRSMRRIINGLAREYNESVIWMIPIPHRKPLEGESKIWVHWDLYFPVVDIFTHEIVP